jgi:hypothetical protein
MYTIRAPSARPLSQNKARKVEASAILIGQFAGAAPRQADAERTGDEADHLGPCRRRPQMSKGGLSAAPSITGVSGLRR